MDGQKDAGAAPEMKTGERERALSCAELFAQALRSAVQARDEAALSELAARDPAALLAPWTEILTCGKVATMALPQAARDGWARGVSILAAAGADPRQPDADRQGWSYGRAPLAEALSREDFEVAQALLGAGAVFSPLSDMLGALGLVTHRHGLERASMAWEWMRGKGFEPWADDAAAKTAQAAFLTLGAHAKASDQAKRAWDDMLFEGAPSGPGLLACMWHHAYGACQAGAALSPALLDRWLSLPGPGGPERAAGLLEWGLASLSQEAVAAALPKLAGEGSWKLGGGLSLEKACDAPPPKSLHAAKLDAAALRGLESEAFDVFWSSCGAQAAKWPVFLEKCAFAALKSRRFGYLDGLARVAGVDPTNVLARWRADGPTPSQRSSAKGSWDEGFSILMGAAMSRGSESGAEDRAERLHDRLCAFEDRNNAERRARLMEMARGEAAKALAAGMRVAIPVPGAPSEAKAAPRL